MINSCENYKFMQYELLIKVLTYNILFYRRKNTRLMKHNSVFFNPHIIKLNKFLIKETDDKKTRYITCGPRCGSGLKTFMISSSLTSKTSLRSFLLPLFKSLIVLKKKKLRSLFDEQSHTLGQRI